MLLYSTFVTLSPLNLLLDYTILTVAPTLEYHGTPELLLKQLYFMFLMSASVTGTPSI